MLWILPTNFPCVMLPNQVSTLHTDRKASLKKRLLSEGCFFVGLLPLILFLPSLARAQQPVYEPFAVDTVAHAQGGSEALDNFMNANLRTPMTALAQGLSGRVILTGIVESNGSMSDVTVLRGFRPDCDQEARRVFRLFHAWQPARKQGKAVRQQVTYPFIFKAGKPFLYVDGTRINYLDEREFSVRDSSSKVRYKLVAPIGNDWLPTGDIVLYKRRRNGWEEHKRYKLTRNELKRSRPDAKKLYRVGYTKPGKTGWYDNQYDVDEDGIIRAMNRWNREGAYDASIYTPEGMLQEHRMRTHLLTDKGFVPCLTRTEWYKNGQIHQHQWTLLNKGIEGISGLWDSTGVKIIDKGRGSVSFINQVSSQVDSVRLTRYTEQGVYERSYKQGLWTGLYEDGSYGYEEFYNAGVCQHGKAWRAGSDTIRYKAAEQQPEFIGGEKSMARFLRDNLNYPDSLQADNIQGDAVIGFTICTDGTLCDYTVLESINPALDEEALRLVRAMSGHWTPGVRRGRPIKSRFKLPVNFRLR